MIFTRKYWLYIKINNMNTIIPEHLSSSFILSEFLNNERHIRIACRNNNCNYIAKLLEVTRNKSATGPMDENEKFQYDAVRNEIIMSDLSSQLGIGPKVHDISLNRIEGYIVMDRYDGTLEDLIGLYKTNDMIPVDLYMEHVWRLLNVLHQNNIIHGDFSSSNIFLHKNREVCHC